MASLVAFASMAIAQRAPQQTQRGSVCSRIHQRTPSIPLSQQPQKGADPEGAALKEGRGAGGGGGGRGGGPGRQEEHTARDRARVLERVQEKDWEGERESAHQVKEASQLLSEAIHVLVPPSGGRSSASGGTRSLLLGRAYSLLNRPLPAFLQLSHAAAFPSAGYNVVSAASFLMAQLLYSAGASSVYSPPATRSATQSTTSSGPTPAESSKHRSQNTGLEGERGVGGETEGGLVVSESCWRECCLLVASLQVHSGASSHEEIEQDLAHMERSHALYFSRALSVGSRDGEGGGGGREGTGEAGGAGGTGGAGGDTICVCVEGVEGLLLEVLRREPKHVGAMSSLANFSLQSCGKRHRWRAFAQLKHLEERLATLRRVQRERRERRDAASRQRLLHLLPRLPEEEDEDEAAVAEAEEALRRQERRLEVGEDDKEDEEEQEEEEARAIHWHERCLEIERHHTTSLLGLALLHMSRALRMRRRGQAATSHIATSHIEEAEMLLCRLLSSNPWYQREHVLVRTPGT